jgi:osmoprotectant transport system permease protein
VTDDLLGLAVAHLRISVLALGLAALVASPLVLAALDRPALRRALLALASVTQTIPALALLAVMVPALAALGATLALPLPSIGELPAVLALSVYALLPIVRGALLGIAGIDRAVLAAAEAVGMTRMQRLRLVELPLATPHLVGGLRTATVWTVGMATLATPVGARSLGELIFAGLQTRHHAEILVGCAAAAALALGLDALLAVVERRSREGGPVRVAALSALAALLVWAPVHTVATTWGGGGPTPIRIGAKGFTEQRVLAALLATTVRSRGRTPRVLPSLGTTVAFDALRTGELDLYVEYTGTVWTTLMHREDLPADRADLRREVEAWLAREHGVRVVSALGFENSYALVVPASSPARRISDLGSASALVIATDYELPARPEWAALARTYALAFRDRRSMDPSLLYDAVASGAVDVASGFSTDPRITALGLRALEDDRGAIPPYDAIVLARSTFLAAHPDLEAALVSLEGTVDAEAMRAASLAVDRDHVSPEDAAAALAR